MECPLIALDKATGVCPMSIGDINHHLLSKCVLLLTGATAIDTCGNFNLSASLLSGIDIYAQSTLAEYSKS